MLSREDLRKVVRQRSRNRLVLFLVDASDSMGDGTTVRMRIAKGAVLALLKRAYLSRDRVALVDFRGEEAHLVLAPTSSIDLARSKLKQLAIGGATPMAAGLQRCREILRNERLRNPELRPLLVIMSDGETNTPLRAGASLTREVLALADSLRAERCASLCIDTGGNREGTSLMTALARVLKGRYVHARELKNHSVLDMIDDWRRDDAPAATRGDGL